MRGGQDNGNYAGKGEVRCLNILMIDLTDTCNSQIKMGMLLFLIFQGAMTVKAMLETQLNIMELFWYWQTE